MIWTKEHEIAMVFCGMILSSELLGLLIFLVVIVKPKILE